MGNRRSNVFAVVVIIPEVEPVLASAEGARD
jgi:hypothetical protein